MTKQEFIEQYKDNNDNSCVDTTDKEYETIRFALDIGDDRSLCKIIHCLNCPFDYRQSNGCVEAIKLLE